MPEGLSHDLERGNLPQVYETEAFRRQSENKKVYSVVDYVPESYSEKPNNLVLANKFQLDPENTIVLVGNTIIYSGTPLESEDVAGLKVKPTEKSNFATYGGDDRLQIKAIKEGGRTIAFATNESQAKQYISQSRKEVA